MSEAFFIALNDGGESTTCPFRGGEGTCTREDAINQAWGCPIDPDIAIALGLDTSQDGRLHQARLAELEWQAKTRRCAGTVIRIDPVHPEESQAVCPTGESMKQSKPRRAALNILRKAGRALISE